MENAYLKSIKARQIDQQEINDSYNDVRKIEKLNITIPSDYKQKLNDYCKANYIKPAQLIRQWIDEYC
jgi:hypothetical protein